MSVKKSKKSEIWAMLFAYLAVSKIFYWLDFINDTLNQGDLRAVGADLLTRLFTQDMLIILGILLVTCIEKFTQLKMSKYKKIWKEIIGHIAIYLLMQGVLFAYVWVRALVLGLPLNWNWGESFIIGGIMYFMIAVVFEVKKFLKKKELIECAPVLSADEKLAMLKALLNNGVFTQEEYDRKKETL